jgi:hypothetical protein
LGIQEEVIEKGGNLALGTVTVEIIRGFGFTHHAKRRRHVAGKDIWYKSPDLRWPVPPVTMVIGENDDAPDGDVAPLNRIDQLLDQAGMQFRLARH